jgi:hypothetical protein
MNRLLGLVVVAACIAPRILSVAQGPAVAPIEITFRLHAPQLDEDTPVFIAGSVTGLGNWNPGKVQMRCDGDHRWSYTLVLSQPVSIEYKYTLGSWQREGARADGQPLQNLTIQSKGLAAGKDFHWVPAPQDGHHEEAWARRLPAALQLPDFFGKK